MAMFVSLTLVFLSGTCLSVTGIPLDAPSQFNPDLEPPVWRAAASTTKTNWTTANDFILGPPSNQETQLRREFELLKSFLAQNMHGLAFQHVLPYMVASPGGQQHVLTKRRLEKRPAVINETVNTIYQSLIDYGFNSVGISDACREQAICNTSNFILNQMPAFVQGYGRDHLMNLPASVFGNNDFTNAWIVGLSSTEASFCPSLFACDDPVMISGGPEPPMVPTQRIPVVVDSQIQYYIDRPGSNANQTTAPMMMMVQVLSNKTRSISSSGGP